MQDSINNLNQFASDNRWVFYPILSAIIVTFMSIKQVGFKKLKDGNHPVQAIVAMLILGGLFGLLMAWITKIMFH